jgi:beta-glucosidase
MLEPGESRRITVTLDRRAMAYWDIGSHDWKVDGGRFVVYVGDSSQHLPLQGTFAIQ